jgi:hypothetical protein
MLDDPRIDPRIKTLLGSEDNQNVFMGMNLVSTIHDDIPEYQELEAAGSIVGDPDIFKPEYAERFQKLSQNSLSDVVNKITQETGFTEDEIRKGVYLIDLVPQYPYNDPNDVYDILGMGVPDDIHDKGYVDFFNDPYNDIRTFVVSAGDHERFLEAIDDYHEKVITDSYFDATGIRLEYGPPRLERHYRYYNPQENVMEREELEYFLVKPSRGLEDIM